MTIIMIIIITVIMIASSAWRAHFWSACVCKAPNDAKRDVMLTY